MMVFFSNIICISNFNSQNDTFVVEKMNEIAPDILC